MSNIAPEIGLYLQHRLRQSLREDPDLSAAEIARQAGMTRERVSTIQSTGSVGWKSAEKLARFFHFADMTALIAAASEWARSAPTQTVATTVRLPAVPEARRALAAALAREDGASEEAIRSVLEEPDLGGSILRMSIRIARRDLEIADRELPAMRVKR